MVFHFLFYYCLDLLKNFFMIYNKEGMRFYKELLVSLYHFFCEIFDHSAVWTIPN